MRARASLIALAVVLFLVPAGAAAAQSLHEPHVGTVVAECDGPVRWHFVHNQVTTADVGTLTATFASAGTVVVDAYKVLSKVRHYEIVTPSGDTLLGASDTISGGNLVLSDTSCVPTVPTDECLAGDTVTVTWGDTRLGFHNIFPLVESASTAVALLPGDYSVTLNSLDPVHEAGYQTDQDEERWYVSLLLNGSQVATTGTISDLPDADLTLSEGVGTVSLPGGADVAVATHLLAGLDYSAYWLSPESVEPASAVFTCL